MESVPLVLVADNDPDVSDVLADALRIHGTQPEIVSDGRAALARLRSGDVDLLVCDLDMPELDGEGVLAALRDDPSAPPVMVVSGYIDDATYARIAGAPHVREVLRKPFDIMEFAERAARTARE